MAKRRLSDKQYAAIALLAQPKRGGLTLEQVAKEVGVSRQSLNNWRNDDGFNDELKRTIMRSTIDRLPEVMQSVPDHIINDGNAAMFRTLLQAQGLLTEKVEVETSDKSVDIDAIRERLGATRKDGED